MSNDRVLKKKSYKLIHYQSSPKIFFLDLLFHVSHCLQGQVKFCCTLFCFSNEFPKTSPWEVESLESSFSLSLFIQMSPQNILEVKSMYNVIRSYCRGISFDRCYKSQVLVLQEEQ